jgi:hypothetical protein
VAAPVGTGGLHLLAYLNFKGRLWKVPQAFSGERLSIRALNTDGR